MSGFRTAFSRDISRQVQIKELAGIGRTERRICRYGKAGCLPREGKSKPVTGQRSNQLNYVPLCFLTVIGNPRAALRIIIYSGVWLAQRRSPNGAQKELVSLKETSHATRSGPVNSRRGNRSGASAESDERPRAIRF